jgi:molybdenum cofactor biosynthesis protein B
MLRRKRYKLLKAEIIPDQKKAVKDTIENHIDQHRPHVIILSGGTGISPRDITYEVVKKLIAKQIDGFGELFRWLSYQDIGTAAMLSRTIAGIHKKTLVISLPGSPEAVRLAMDKLIIPEVGHIINLIHEVGKE